MAKILAVDDEPDMIWAITNVLLSENHSVVSVNSGEEALEKVEKVPVDLVLLDFRLPGMDGVQILEKIKQIRPELPVIMVTGYGGVEEAVQSIKLGAAHYIPKPFDNDHLIETVNKSLNVTRFKKEGIFEKRLMEKIVPDKSDHGKDVQPRIVRQSRPPGKGRFAAVLSSLGVLAALGAGTFWYLSPAVREYAVSAASVSGISWGNDRVWVSDWLSENIQTYQLRDSKMEFGAKFKLKGFHVTGLARGGEFLYTCDSWKKKIYKHDLDTSLTVLASYDSPGPNPSGLYYDDNYLWSCDGTTRMIYRHSLDADLTVVESFPSQGVFPVGLYHDDRDFWSASAVEKKVYTNLMDQRFAGGRTFSLPETLDVPQQISAFTVRNGTAWIAFEGVGKLYRVSLSRLKETPP